MSGVEIAGFVLASLPLMISFLEHYRDTNEVLEGWWKVKREYKKCMGNLKYHRLAFEENLEELLLPLIADEDRLQELLKEPGGPAWKDPELEKLLKSRMPKTYASYLDTIEMMMETVQGLDDALGMSKTHFQNRIDGKQQLDKPVGMGTRAMVVHVTTIGKSNFEWQSQRIKLAFNKAGRQQLFDEFGALNGRLRDILGSSDRLANLRRARVSKQAGTSKSNSALWKFWNHGNHLYNLLTEAWSCHCQSFHYANLLLQHRITPTVNFRVLFWFKTHLNDPNASAPLPWIWQDTSINLLDEEAVIKIAVPKINLQSIVDIPTSPQNSAHQPLTPQPTTNRPTAVKKSSFMDRWRNSKTQGIPAKPASAKVTALPSLCNPPVVSSVRPPMQTEQDLSNETSANNLQRKPKVSFVADNHAEPDTSDITHAKITNLCTIIATCAPELPRYGCLEGEAQQYVVQPLCKAGTQPQHYIDLGSLLSKSSSITLTRRQRFQIALILASSHIQLHPTPWLNSRWNKKDVVFVYDAHDRTKLSTDQPYVSRSLSKSMQNAVVSTNSYTFQDSIRNLGIMLLELCFGTAIEDHKLRQNLTGADEQTIQLVNYAVAMQWVRDVVEEAGPEFSDAVTWCLHHSPECTTTDGKEDNWREDMYIRVVEPLKYCHDQLMGI